ncbi:hypothetical protein [Sulfitobacter geojensis]|uniref:hypothetical protein n=1 Tax=Sulfitobacter geojensis TaxID=1342299 RepID=UPI000469A473|nr:hypothetical protein [Sulfitobacter geojensis]NYI29315.1 hypothetical protein [Sulfitobacter geojensis]
MTPTGPGLRTIIRINLNFFFGTVLCAVAWLAWPDTKEAWRMGLIAIIYGLGGVCMILKSFIEIIQYLFRDRAVNKFQRQGRAPQADRLADNDALRKSGMIK